MTLNIYFLRHGQTDSSRGNLLKVLADRSHLTNRLHDLPGTKARNSARSLAGSLFKLNLVIEI
jgi:broad specificity phosphatase PhoE